MLLTESRSIYISNFIKNNYKKSFYYFKSNSS